MSVSATVENSVTFARTPSPNEKLGVKRMAKIHGMGCVRESKIRLYVAGRRVNVLLASSGCAPHCTRRPAPGVLPL
jgi:hypothetical protein